MGEETTFSMQQIKEILKLKDTKFQLWTDSPFNSSGGWTFLFIQY